MHRGHTPGGDGAAVGHTDGIGHPGLAEYGAGGSQTVQVGRVDHRIATETRMVGALLIGHDEQNIRGMAHAASVPGVKIPFILEQFPEPVKAEERSINKGM